MKKSLQKLNEFGAAHIVLPLLVIVSVAAVGTYFLVASHAQVPPDKGGSSPYITCSFSASPTPKVGAKVTVTGKFTNLGAATKAGQGISYTLWWVDAKSHSYTPNAANTMYLSSIGAGQTKSLTLTTTIPKTVPYYGTPTKYLKINSSNVQVYYASGCSSKSWAL